MNKHQDQNKPKKSTPPPKNMKLQSSVEEYSQLFFSVEEYFRFFNFGGGVLSFSNVRWRSTLYFLSSVEEYFRKTFLGGGVLSTIFLGGGVLSFGGGVLSIFQLRWRSTFIF
jgi:hypothetical protein